MTHPKWHRSLWTWVRNSATWGATITGVGSDVVLGFCDGTAWTVAAK